MSDRDDMRFFAVMDADCVLCSNGARWIARNDPDQTIRLIPMQSDMGRYLLTKHGLDADRPKSWLYVEDGKAFTSLEAYVRIGQRLGGIWKGLVALRVFPKFVQDAFYYWIARNRYRLFGHTGVCTFPDRPQAAR